eukprot:6200144-Pleurochrysis_carterae.AAC.3
MALTCSAEACHAFRRSRRTQCRWRLQMTTASLVVQDFALSLSRASGALPLFAQRALPCEASPFAHTQAGGSRAVF